MADKKEIIVAPLMPTRGHPHYQAEHALRVASIMASKAGISMFHPRHRTSSAVHENRNCMIADLAVDTAVHKIAFTHVLFQDDDIVLPEDAIVKMVAADKPIVGALCTTRSDPPIPNARIYSEEGAMPYWKRVFDYGSGLEKYAVGAGAILIDFEKVIKPMAMIYLDCLFERDIYGMSEAKATEWSRNRKAAFNQYPNAWWYRWLPSVDGVDENSEDIFFCWTAKRYLDIETWVDCSIQPGHIGEVSFSIKDYEARRHELIEEAVKDGRYHPKEGDQSSPITPKIFVAMSEAAKGNPVGPALVKQEFIPTKTISVILPTRGRWPMLQESIDSLLDKASLETRIEIIVRFDDDDLPANTWKQRPQVLLFSGPRFGYRGIHNYYNELAPKATGDWILPWSDDAVMETEGWDEIIHAQGGGLKILNATGKLNLFPIVTRELYEVLGHWSMQTHSDSWLQVIGRLNGIEYPVDLHIRHLRDEGLEDQTKKESLATYAVSSPEFFSQIFQEKLRRDVKKVHKAVERMQKLQLKREYAAQ